MRRGRRSMARRNAGILKTSGRLWIPGVLKTRMTWAGLAFQNSLATGLVWNTEYRGNSIYDPDTTIGITQISANGYQTLKKMYRYWYVSAAKITVEFCWYNTAAPGWIICALQAGATGYTTLQATELDRCEMVPGLIYKRRSSWAAEPHTCKLHMYRTTRSMFKLDRNFELRGDVEGGTAATIEPTKQWFFHIYFMQTDGSASVTNVRTVVTIKYYTTWSQRYIPNFGSGIGDDPLQQSGPPTVDPKYPPGDPYYTEP